MKVFILMKGDIDGWAEVVGVYLDNTLAQAEAERLRLLAEKLSNGDDDDVSEADREIRHTIVGYDFQVVEEEVIE